MKATVQGLLWFVTLTSSACATHAYVHPSPPDYALQQRVLSRAYQIESVAWELYQGAGSGGYRYDWDESRLGERLRRLYRRARDYRREVERHYWSDRAARNDFEKLLREYSRVKEELRYVRVSRGASYRIGRLGYTLDGLYRYYAGYGYRYGR